MLEAWVSSAADFFTNFHMLTFFKGLFGSDFEFFTFEWLVLLEYKNFVKYIFDLAIIKGGMVYVHSA